MRRPQRKVRQSQKVVIPSRGLLYGVIERFKMDKRLRLAVLAFFLIGGSLVVRSCLTSNPSIPLPLDSEKIEPAVLPTSPKAVFDSKAAAQEETATDQTTTNRVPEIKSVVLEPAPAFPGDILKVRVEVVDKDGDSVQLNYRWLCNGQVIEDAVGESLDTSDLTKKDTVSVEVTPSDIDGEGVKVEANLVLNNRPPKIISSPAMTLVDGRYFYEVKAKDDDGDPLVYSLEKAPTGMTIDNTGRIAWNIPEGVEGLVTGLIIVSDGEARALQLLQLTFAQSTAR